MVCVWVPDTACVFAYRLRDLSIALYLLEPNHGPPISQALVGAVAAALLCVDALPYCCVCLPTLVGCAVAGRAVVIVPGAPSAAAAGLPDIVAALAGQDVVMVYRNLGTAAEPVWTETIATGATVVDNPRDVVAIDINNDGLKVLCRASWQLLPSPSHAYMCFRTSALCTLLVPRAVGCARPKARMQARCGLCSCLPALSAAAV
jgi:hypothetical protein